MWMSFARLSIGLLGRCFMRTAGLLVFLLVIAATRNITSVPSSAQSSRDTTAEPLAPMPSDAKPSFDVVTIKPSDTSAPHGTFFRTDGRHVIGYNVSVSGLIVYAYGLHEKQVVGGPPSLLNSHFDVDGVPDIDGRPNRSQFRLMFQKMLASRFKLSFHYESREMSAYALRIGKGGPKLVPTTRKASDGTNFSYNCQAVLTVRNASIADIAQGMEAVFVDRPVIDQTGLHDRYDFDLKWTPDELQSYCPRDTVSAQNNPNAPPDLYTAMQEQLGLKIIRTNAPIQVMVIDHIESPSQN